ncbi:hypothetical protein THASP1DRAFT_30693 [Thamnocephalis sphaerospora]|uniref:TOG domain-containing protein n=1 Tax=Thamnocephalis sphaerospora TaxID=78915 RepID=A0A4P9XNE3_9FUNG|nr:hypothetical protein THASP1DRAFT_30693 [Thamnocephalis sphaerospora]|eukprot:RKP07487.1 hypothetical protein THASP1DRAFT_30693 [Thamnocephalis sphaerospora]
MNALDDCITGLDSAERTYGISTDEMKQRITVNLDLILKYLSLRLYDNGTTMLLKCMDLVEHLFGMLDESGYRMTEYEAGVFLPHFVSTQLFAWQLSRIYPASRIFAVILDQGLKSKNSRTRAESLDELGSLIQRNSLSVCTPQKALPTIAAHIGDRDASVRNGAINALLQAYLLVGSSVHKYLGRISEKDKDMLEERFRRNKPAGFDEEPTSPPEDDEPAPIFSFQKARVKSAVPAPSGGATSGIPGPSFGFARRQLPQPSLRASQPPPPPEPEPEPEPESEPMDVDDGPEPAPIPAPTRQLTSRLPMRDSGMEPRSSLRRPNFGTPPRQFGLNLDRLNLPQASDAAGRSEIPTIPEPAPMFSAAPTPRMPMQQRTLGGGMERPERQERRERRQISPDVLASEITSGDSHRSLSVLKQLEAYLVTDYSIVLPHVNDLVRAITLQVHLSFTAPDTESQTFVSLCKHLINCLVQLFSKREIAEKVAEDTLHQVLKELLFRLLDQDLQQWETGTQLTRALNMLMIRILDNTSRDAAFSALLSVLQSSSAMLRSVDASRIGFQTKFTELVMKCIWKLTKTLQDSIKNSQLQTNQLLLNVHNFFVALPPAEWKRRVAERVPLADMPHKTVKTILHEVVAVWGNDVLLQLDLIPDASKSYLYSYLSLVLDPSRKRTSGEPSSSRPNSRSGSVQSQHPEETSARRSLDERPDERALGSGRSSSRTGRSTPPTHAASRDRASSPSSKRADPVHSRLTQIFIKISTSEKTKQGIMELYEFQRDHPEEEQAVEGFLKKAGTFQSYIRRTLANISTERGDARPASAGTPPPMSPGGPMSPARTSSWRRTSLVLDHPEPASPASISSESDAYKQRLLRLQQMFGYQSQDTSASSSPASSRPESMISAGRTPSSAALDYNKRSSVPMSLTSEHISEMSRPKSADVERAQTMADLRERLARMKNAVSGASAATPMDVDDDDDDD